jgi:hypothetical protein
VTPILVVHEPQFVKTALRFNKADEDFMEGTQNSRLCSTERAAPISEKGQTSKEPDWEPKFGLTPMGR